jgi:N-acetylneuraminic acid mutarotase
MTVVLMFMACHGGSSGTSSSHTIGGTITGLKTGGVVLANGTVTVSVAAGASTWVFPSSFASNTAYSVTVVTQPAGELCEVSSGSGATLPDDVTNVAVACSAFGQWVWEGGLDSVNASGVYGTQGAASASNFPGARQTASSWIDSFGNLWLFGGVGYDSTDSVGNLNDLWRFSQGTGQWTWIGGANTDNAAGIYGTQGTAAASNVPGARYSASSWIDASGNLWLFGGYGSDSTGAAGKLDDLWRFSPGTGQWTWINGASTDNAAGVYGALGTAAAGNVPGARYAATSWIDASGNLWLFGGYGSDSTGTVGRLNDLWEYSASSGQWSWVGGSSVANATGSYGTLEIAAAGNGPGARQAANSWIDSSGTVWLFGGYGYDSTGDLGYLNDLWQYSSSSGQWTWVSGSSTDNASGIYGTQGTVSASNVPGARQAANSWIDSSGSLWLFGGYGHDSVDGLGALNDLWQFSPGTKQWTSVSGGDVANAAGVYGIQGTASDGALPGARQGASSWVDPSGHLLLFGGAGYGATGNGYLNDVWQFVRPQ